MTQTPTSYASLVATEIRAEMARQRKTQVGLAKLLGVSDGTANNRFSGAYPYDLDELKAVACWLDTSVANLSEAAERNWRAAS